MTLRRQKNRHMIGVHLYFGCFIIFLSFLICCTIWGEQIYQFTTTGVKAEYVKKIQDDEGKVYARIPRKFVYEDSVVYTVTSQQGYSRELYYVWMDKISFSEYGEDAEEIMVPIEQLSGELMVTEIQKGKTLEEGERVYVINGI